MRRARSLGVALLALGLASGGCADVVDTELGLDADIDTASVEVTPAVVAATVQVTYRVGPFAEGERVFQPQAIDLFVGDALVANLSPMPAGEFEQTVAPGEAFTATFEGGMSGITEPERLCSGDVRVIFRWIDQATFEIGMTEALADSVTCP